MRGATVVIVKIIFKWSEMTELRGSALHGVCQTAQPNEVPERIVRRLAHTPKPLDQIILRSSGQHWVNHFIWVMSAARRLSHGKR